MIESGGAHINMPIWGDILTSDQITALVNYTLESGSGTGITAGAILYADNCVACHGKYGEGGPNPSLQGDIIAPISSSEYLKTRDDNTLRNIISQGQPDFGMSPFGESRGGSLSDDQIEALLAFIRNWEKNPPVVPVKTATPPAPSSTKTPSGGDVSFADQIQPIFQSRCNVCHSSSSGQAGYDSTTYQGVMTSGDSGSQVIPGDGANSPLVKLVQATSGVKMPPVGDRLSDAEIQAIIDWINAGAKDN
jgi:mono/diheme cytochrome c family protein